MTKKCSKGGSTDLLIGDTISCGVIHTICNSCGQNDIYNQKLYNEVESTYQKWLKKKEKLE